MLKFVDIDQNTDEWFQMRAGKLTSSKLGVIMANYGKAFGEPAKKYAVSIAIEQLTGMAIESSYSNDHMQRGHDQEPIARMLYEEYMFCNVSKGGFFTSDFVGCSPDGLINDCGLIEIKSVIENIHFATVKRQSLDPSYKWQCIGNLMFTGRDWLDFVSYCSAFPEDKQLFVKRIWKDNLSEEFKMISIRVDEFKRLVEETKSTIKNNQYYVE